MQRTPNEDISASNDASAPFHHPTENVPYNTYFLAADEKGCNACHEDLAKTIENMPYGHPGVASGINTEVTVQQCLDCHVPESYGMSVPNEFGVMIHGIHAQNDRADCMNCHVASESNLATPESLMGTNSGMLLWDQVKHTYLHGITDIESAELKDTFAFRQDETIPASDLFDIRFQNSESDYARVAHIENDDPLDEEMFNNWTISVLGEVNQEKSWTLPELIAKAPSETTTMKLNCQLNGVGGSLIGQVEVTGIPLSWLFDQAGLKDTAKSVSTNNPEGEFSRFNLADHANDKAYLVYEMDGERLSWSNGYPVMYIMGGTVAATDTKQILDFVVLPEETEEYVGFADQNGVYYTKPNIGLFDLREGQIFMTGETAQLHGYADGIDKRIVAIEFSTDRGATWKRFETPNTNTDQWITWTYDFTPEADGAYCFMLRAVADDGTMTADPLEKMIVAKSEMPSDDEVVK